MGRGHWHPASCKVCGKLRGEGHHISQTGLCLDHAKQRFSDNFDALQTMSGPYAEHWRRRLAASVGGVLVDDLPDPA